MEKLKFLSDDEIKAMHEATLHIMAEIGIIWTHKPSLDILTGAGCTIKDNRICFPPDLVMNSIATANKKPSIKGRNGQVNSFGSGNLYFHNLGGARDIFDAKTNTRRPATNQDAVDAIRVLDSARVSYPRDRNVLLALAILNRDAGDTAAAARYARLLVESHPDDARGRELLQSLTR